MKIVELLRGLQDRLRVVVGADMWFPESSRLHLSVLEISHRHPMTHLKAIYSQMGTDLLREMLNYPAVFATGSGQKRARLGKPMLVFDKVGVAIGFVPTGEDQYTYHHLRTDLYGMALRSGVKMDTCYTACTAHMTLGRFVSTTTFDSDSDEGTQKHIQN
ncbi:hypothetical protein CISG_09946 [Coccidioides immitis RMSCC 3703]|nr:hypothetical protein CISG_09946 [Coccidioides immitis RMSCC 3703]